MADINEYRLKMFVTGSANAANRAIAALRRLGHVMAQRVHSEVVDALLYPELFLHMGDEPLPALVRVAPEPVRMFRGSITEPGQMARLLDQD